MLLNDYLKKHPLYIIDIGASGGIHPRWNTLTSEYRALLFEPDIREFERLKLQASDKYIILNAALSDRAGDIWFNLCKKQQVSSIYKPNFPFLNKFPEADRFEIVKTVKIITDTLDNQLNKNNITDIDFIKIDTQGHNLPILKGAEKALRNAVGVEVEVEFAPIYENQPLFSDVNEFMIKHGFELYDLSRHFWKRKSAKSNYIDTKGQLIFGDVLYFRSPETICSFNAIKEDKLVRAICVYLAYGYAELALALCDSAYKEKLLSEEVYKMLELFSKKYKKNKGLPNFRGKNRVHTMMSKITNALSSRIWHSGDKIVGM